MGKKSRRKHEANAKDAAPSGPRWWDNRWAQVAGAIALLAASAGIGIGAVTLMGGDSLSEPDGPKFHAPTPSGEQPTADRSAAADLLASKSWAEMTIEERTLAVSEFVRAFQNATFRTKNTFVLTMDVWRRDGQTKASRVYFESGEPGPDGRDFLYTRTSFYCNLPGGGFRAYRYLKSPTETQFEASDPNTIPRAWDDAVIAGQWSGDVDDLGLREVNGREARGYEVGFRSASDGDPIRAQYWFDVETAQLLQRAEVLPKKVDMDAQAYRLDYAVLPAIDISGAPEVPECVRDIIALLEG